MAMNPRLQVHVGALLTSEQVALGSHCVCVQAETHFITLHTKPGAHERVASHSGTSGGAPLSTVGADAASFVAAAEVPASVLCPDCVAASSEAPGAPASSSVSALSPASVSAFTPASSLVRSLSPASIRKQACLIF
jgi:hypothetical protein